MPDKEGSDDEKTTKGVVKKKQKQMMGEEGYDHYRDNILMRGGDHRSKETKERSYTPTGKQPKGDTPMQKEFKKKYGKKATALDAVKQKYKGQIMNVGKKGKKKVKEELDLTKIAEAFGGYIVEAKKDKKEEDKLKNNQTNNQKNNQTDKDKLDFSDDQKPYKPSRPLGKSDPLTSIDQPTATERDVDDYYAQRDITQSGETIRPRVSGTPQGRDFSSKELKSAIKRGRGVRKLPNVTAGGEVKVTKVDPRTLKNNPTGKIKKSKPTPQQRYSQALKTTEPPVIKAGPSVKRGDPIPQKVKPVKNIASRKSAEDKITTELQGKRFALGAPQRKKTFKQAFGRPTGADYKTGKPTYRVSPVGPAGEKRTRTRGGFKALPRSKNLPDYDTTKTAVDMGLNPDEIDKNKFIDQKVRGDRMDKLGTPDPFDPDYDKKVKKVDQRTKTAKAFKAPKYTVYGPERPKVSTKVDTQPKQDFKGFTKTSRRAKRMGDTTKPVSVKQIVDRDIDRKIAQVAAKTRKSKIATPVVKTLGKETGEAAVKAAGKKAMRKGAVRALSKQIPGVGSIIAGGEAAFRAAKGDMTGAGLSLAQAVPGLGIGAAVADVARDVVAAKGGARVGQKTATQVARSLTGKGTFKKTKTATKVVNPTVVGTSADAAARVRRFMRNPKNMGPMMVGGAVLGKGIETASRKTFRAIKPQGIRGGTVGRRSAGR